MNNDLLECAIFNLPLTTNNVQVSNYLFQIRVFIHNCFMELGLSNPTPSRDEINNFIKENEIQIIYTPSFRLDRYPTIKVVCEKQNYDEYIIIKD